MTDEASKTVTFHYLKGQDFRVVHVDGGVGGITPQGLIHLAVYAERAAIPQLLVHDVDAAGNLGEIKETVSKPGVVRELQVDLIFTRPVAEGIYKWLGEKLREYDLLATTLGKA
jgi:hypothetical protein